MKALVAALVGAALLGPAPAQAVYLDLGTEALSSVREHVPKRCQAPAFRGWSQRVWNLIRWERGQPKPRTIRAQRRVLRCAPPGHRRAMQRRWRLDKAAYYRHRGEQRAERRALEALTPYDCGSAGRYAIPCYIVECESGYDWGAVNPTSGAFSVYQFLPSTYAAYCTTCDRSQEDLHRAAGTLYREAGGAPWVCA